MRTLLAATTVCLFLTAPAHSQTVGMLGDWQKIEFEGLQEVDADEIRHALAGDLEFQAAARPSASLEKFLEITEDRITQGFRHSGYVKAKVDLVYDEGRDRVVVRADEGAKYTLGEIRLVGNSHIDIERIRKALTSAPRERYWSYETAEGNIGRLTPSERRKAKAIWNSGDVAKLDSTSISQLVSHARLAVFDAGYSEGEFKIEPIVDESSNKINLNVEFSRDQRPGNIVQFEIRGLSRHTEQEVLEYLGVHPGMRFDCDQLDKIYELVRQSCRFWTYEMSVRGIDAGAPDKERGGFRVSIDVIEYAHAPKLGEPLPAVDDALRRAANWLNNYGQDPSEPQVDLSVFVDGEIGDFNGLCMFCYSPNQGFAATVVGLYDRMFALDHSLLAGPDQVSLFSGLQQRRLALPGKLPTVMIHLLPTHFDGEDYRVRLGLGAKFSSEELSSVKSLDIAIEPVAIVHEAHRDGPEVEIVGDRLRVRGPFYSTAIDVNSGQVIEIACDPATREIRFDCFFRSRAFENAKNELVLEPRKDYLTDSDNSRPVLAAARFALADVAAQPGLRRGMELSGLLKFAQQWLNSSEPEELANELTMHRFVKSSERDRFSIPRSGISEDGILTFCKVLMPALADMSFPRGSWPWISTREMGLYSLIDDTQPPLSTELRQGADIEMRSQFSSGQAGSVCAYFSALSFAELGTNRGSNGVRSCAAYGSRQLTEEAFLRDISPFIDGDLWAAKAIEFLVQHCDEFENVLILDAAPQSVRDAAKKLITRRKSQPDESPREALRAVLLECWRETWREQLAAEFTRLSNLHDNRIAQALDEPHPSTEIAPNDPLRMGGLPPLSEGYRNNDPAPRQYEGGYFAREAWQELE